MYCEKQKNGTYKYVERYTDPLSGKVRRVSVVMAKNTAQARRDAKKTLDAKIDAKCSVVLQPAEVTFGELVTEYLKRSSELVHATQKKNASNMRYWETLIGKDTLVKMLPKLNILAMMERCGETPETMNERLTRFKALVRWGYSAGLIESAEFLGRLRSFKAAPHRDSIVDKYLERDEYKRLLPELTIDKWRLLTEFLVLSGMRFGEAAALEVQDVDFDARVIRVTKTWNAANGSTTHAKTRSSIRDIYMQPQLLHVAMEINAYMIRRRLLPGCGKLFLVDDRGCRVSHAAFNKYLKHKSLEICGREVTVHALRHTSASIMFEQGFDENEVARRLGHHNSKITRDIYIHVTKVLEERDKQRLNTFIV